MIPRAMEAFLKTKLPERTLQNRLIREGERCYLEFGPLDVDRLSRLDISVDNLGPRLVACMWNESSPLEIGGYLVVDNLAMGRPSMGGIRMLPEVTPAAIHNLARGMTLKNAAANLPYGGGKSGIVADPGVPADQHSAIVEGFARLIYRYKDIYLPGPDVGTNDADMKTIAIQNGIDHALSKPVDMGGNRIDQLGAAAGSCVISLLALLEEMPRLSTLPQFQSRKTPQPEAVSVLIQGFGAVGAHAARLLMERLPGCQVTGISDALGYLFDPEGLPAQELFDLWVTRGMVTRPYAQASFLSQEDAAPPFKYSTDPNDLLRESGFCLMPAAPIANYLDTDPSTNPSMTVDRMGKWSVIIEGANTYSPDPTRKAARARMERAVYRENGILIATDYLVNSGGVIFAAQEHLIKTPSELRIPKHMLGNRPAVDRWLAENSSGFDQLAAQRRTAAENYRDEVIRRNMRELVDLLITDADMLPYEAAERISIQRIASSEADRTARDLMVPIPTITVTNTAQDAAKLLIDSGSPILAVTAASGEFVGVVTSWDITRATALGSPDDTPLEKVMTHEVIAAAPYDSILDMLRKLEHHEISAMPVVDDDCVVGVVSADLLATRSLMRLVQSQLPL